MISLLVLLMDLKVTAAPETGEFVETFKA